MATSMLWRKCGYEPEHIETAVCSVSDKGPSLRLKLLWYFNQTRWTFAVCKTHHKSFPKICVIPTLSWINNACRRMVDRNITDSVKELFLCFQKLVRGGLHTFYFLGGFPVRESNLRPWSEAPNRQQYMTDALTNWAKSPTLKEL